MVVIFSNGMDVDSILRTYRYFPGRVRMSFGWATNLTNDFRGCDPLGGDGLEPISLICKVVSADGRPAVKLSDNPAKATGDPSEIVRYLRIFGDGGRVASPVAVYINRTSGGSVAVMTRSAIDQARRPCRKST